MGKVKILSKNIYSKIQAGEVIEGPSSVIRELIDNSIDANSKSIIVELLNSGFTAIIVKDDGYGIEKDDLKIVFKNHATSKINSESDLNNINTLGFRGEALYSIASVSRLNIKSKVADEDSGYMIKVYGGKEIDFYPISMNKGTIVNIQDLFYNVPARKKFLNNSKKELKIIKKLFLNKAASTHNISFKLINNGKTIYNFMQKETFFDRIKDILGENTYKYLIKLDTEKIANIDNDFLNNFKINKLQLIYSSRDFYSKYRSFFLIIVNGRPVVEEEVIKKIRSFYYSYLPRGFYPYFILNMKLDPFFLDQNIDPTKNKIKIENDSVFANKIVDIVKHGLSSETITFRYNFDNDIIYQKYYNNSIKIKENKLFEKKGDPQKDTGKINSFELINKDFYNNGLNNNEIDFNEDNKFNGEEKFNKINDKIISNNFGEFKTIIFSTYLVFEKEDTIFLIDYHAAYERLNYNKLKANFKNKRKRSLLFPEIIKLKYLDNVFKKEIVNKIKILNENGFEIEMIGDKNFQLVSVPDIIKQSDESILLEELNSFLEDDSLKSIELEHLINKVIARLACRISPKANDRLNIIDIKKFVSEFNTNVSNYESCPHGRPTIIKFDKQFFDKKFYRKK